MRFGKSDQMEAEGKCFMTASNQYALTLISIYSTSKLVFTQQR